MFYLNFDLSNNVWWRSVFISNNSVIKSDIEKRIKLINKFRSSECNNDIIHGFTDLYINLYLKDCLVGENNITNDSLSNIDAIIDEYLKKRIDFTTKVPRETIKIVNMFDAIQTTFFSSFNLTLFTPEFAAMLHQQIGARNLIKNAGKYRVKPAKPSTEDCFYLDPEEIEETMHKLFAMTRTAIEQINDGDIDSIVKISAQFLVNFLQIHPFSNGNGRVARLLTSRLLLSISVVPVSLTEGKKSDNFIKCLQEEQNNGTLFNYKPVALATLILERVWLSLNFCCSNLDLYQ